MTLADQYAKALWEVVGKNPAQASTYLKNLHRALQKRDHAKLLPRILWAYENLETSEKCRAQMKVMTPEMRRTRTLVEFYKRLTASGSDT